MPTANFIIARPRDDDQALGCAVAVAVSLALWGLIAALIWALTTL